jgi:hypothetical protein
MTDMCNAVAMRLGSAGASLATPSKSAMGPGRVKTRSMLWFPC